MVLYAEIALTAVGLYVLIKRRWPLGRQGYLVGKQATILGVLALLTLPVLFVFVFALSLAIGVVWGADAITQWVGIGIEAAGLILWLILIFALQARYRRTGQVVPRSTQLKGLDEPPSAEGGVTPADSGSDVGPTDESRSAAG